ncbi:hypothetical protein DH86_00001533 [Scytalidium sp. 3C]|nr:hypothetical protein DH86_00001533 [Scytalidium sp. 3C]
MAAMVSQTPLSEKHANGKSGAGSGSSKAERMPGTPRKDSGLGKEKGVQDPGLKDYRLGECLGKGAFGSVYKAFNWGTGEAVAVKQIKLGDLPKSELRMIEVTTSGPPSLPCSGKALTGIIGGNRPSEEPECKHEAQLIPFAS